MSKEKQKKHKSLSDIVTYVYLRKIKKWMFCPACQSGKMTIDKKSPVWTCINCGYELSADEFENDYTFWFCDECSSYLNNQEGFDKTASRHICRVCGYENDTTFTNVKGIWSDCGAIVPDADSTLCEGCRNARKEKANTWLSTASKVAGAVVAVARAIYAASRASESKNEDATDSLESTSKNEAIKKKAKYKIIFDGEEQDEIFDTEKAAEEYALYLCSCTQTGAEILHLSNPGDYDYEENTFENPGYEIVEEYDYQQE